MNFTLTDERQMVQDSLRRFLTDRYTTDLRNRIIDSEQGFSPDIWAGLAEMGILGALFPEDQGGFGGAGFDIALVFEELGRAGVVEPLGEALLAGGLLADTGQTAHVNRIISGDLHATLAHGEPDSRYDLSHVATRIEAGKITGRKAVVMNGGTAEVVLVTARHDGGMFDEAGITLALVPKTAPGITVHAYPTIDGSRAAEITFDQTPVEVLSDHAFPLLTRHIARATLATMAETLGTIETAKALTVDYLKTRHQFGRPIGKFQALQHRMADLAIEVEQARSAVINAAGHLDTPKEALHISAAKNLIGRTARLVAEEAIQLHGGIGMTREYALAYFAKRMVMADHKFGDTDHHLERFIALSRV